MGDHQPSNNIEPDVLEVVAFNAHRIVNHQDLPSSWGTTTGQIPLSRTSAV